MKERSFSRNEKIRRIRCGGQISGTSLCGRQNSQRTHLPRKTLPKQTLPRANSIARRLQSAASSGSPLSAAVGSSTQNPRAEFHKPPKYRRPARPPTHRPASPNSTNLPLLRHCSLPFRSGTQHGPNFEPPKTRPGSLNNHFLRLSQKRPSR